MKRYASSLFFLAFAFHSAAWFSSFYGTRIADRVEDGTIFPQIERVQTKPAVDGSWKLDEASHAVNVHAVRVHCMGERTQQRQAQHCGL